MKNKKLISISHKDLDGLVSVILLADFCRSKKVKFEYILCTYRDVDRYFKEIQHEKCPIFITDISLDEDKHPDLENMKNLTWIDHHPREVKSRIRNQYHAIDKGAGCMMVLDYIEKNFNYKFSKNLKILAKVASDYDTWTHEYPVSKNLNTIFFSYYHKDFFERFENGWDGKFNDREKAYLYAKDIQIVKIKDELQINELHQNVSFVVLTEEIDVIAEYVMEKTDADYCIVYNQKIRSLSFRSRRDDGIHLGEFLNQFGGGGHEQAAATRLKNEDEMPDIIDSFLKEVDKKEYYFWHPESECVWIVRGKDQEIGMDEHDGLVSEIDRKQYLELKRRINVL